MALLRRVRTIPSATIGFVIIREIVVLIWINNKKAIATDMATRISPLSGIANGE